MRFGYVPSIGPHMSCGTERKGTGGMEQDEAGGGSRDAARLAFVVGWTINWLAGCLFRQPNA